MTSSTLLSPVAERLADKEGHGHRITEKKLNAVKTLAPQGTIKTTIYKGNHKWTLIFICFFPKFQLILFTLNPRTIQKNFLLNYSHPAPKKHNKLMYDTNVNSLEYRRSMFCSIGKYCWNSPSARNRDHSQNWWRHQHCCPRGCWSRCQVRVDMDTESLQKDFTLWAA